MSTIGQIVSAIDINVMLYGDSLSTITDRFLYQRQHLDKTIFFGHIVIRIFSVADDVTIRIILTPHAVISLHKEVVYMAIFICTDEVLPYVISEPNLSSFITILEKMIDDSLIVRHVSRKHTNAISAVTVIDEEMTRIQSIDITIFSKVKLVTVDIQVQRICGIDKVISFNQQERREETLCNIITTLQNEDFVVVTILVVVEVSTDITLSGKLSSSSECFNCQSLKCIQRQFTSTTSTR